jgi:hypothetical protein
MESRALGCAYGEEKAAASVFFSPHSTMDRKVAPMWDHVQNQVIDLD